MRLKVFYNAYGKRLFMGILADENKRIFFEYAPEFIADGLFSDIISSVSDKSDAKLSPPPPHGFVTGPV